jgi:hypothetical protein
MTLAARWMKPHSDDHPIAVAPIGAANPGPGDEEQMNHSRRMSNVVGRIGVFSSAFGSNRIFI